MGFRARNKAQVAMYNQIANDIRRITDDTVKGPNFHPDQLPQRDFNMLLEATLDGLPTNAKKQYSKLSPERQEKLKANLYNEIIYGEKRQIEGLAKAPDPNSKEGVTGDVQSDEPPDPQFGAPATKTNQAPKQVVGQTTDADGETVKQIADLSTDKPGSGVLSSGVSTFPRDQKILDSTQQLLDDGENLLNSIEDGTAVNPNQIRRDLSQFVSRLSDAREELTSTTMSASFEDSPRLKRAAELRGRIDQIEKRINDGAKGSVNLNDPNVSTGMDDVITAWADKVGDAVIEENMSPGAKGLQAWAETESDLAMGGGGAEPPKAKYRVEAGSTGDATNDSILADSRIASPDEAIGENVELLGSPVLLEDGSGQSKSLFSFIPASDDTRSLMGEDYQPQRVFVLGDVVPHADDPNKAIIKFGTDHYMPDEGGFRKLEPGEWNAIRGEYKREVIASDRDASFAAAKEAQDRLEEQNTNKGMLPNPLQGENKAINDRWNREAISEREVNQLGDLTEAGDPEATLFVYDTNRHGYVLTDPAKAEADKVPLQQRVYVRIRPQDATDVVDRSGIKESVKTSLGVLSDMLLTEVRKKFPAIDRSGLSPISRSSKPNSLETHRGASLGTAGSNLDQGRAAAQDLANMLRAVGTPETRQLLEESNATSFLSGFKTRQDRGRDILSLFTDKDGTRSYATDAQGNIITDESGLPITISRQLTGDDPAVSGVTLPEGYLDAQRPKDLDLQDQEVVIRKVGDYLVVDEQVKQLEDLGQTDNQGYADLKLKKNTLELELAQLTGSKSAQDLVDNVLDTLIYNNLKGSVDGTATKRVDGANAPTVNSGYTVEGVSTGQIDPDGKPITTTPPPSSVPESMRGFLVNDREGGVSTVGDVFELRQRLERAADISSNAGTGVKISDEDVTFLEVPDAPQAIAGAMRDRFDAVTAKSLQSSFFDEYRGLVNEGIQDVEALGKIGRTLMKNGFAPTDNIIEAARSKRDRLARRLEEAQAKLRDDEAKNAGTSNYVDNLAGPISNETLDQDRRSINELTEAFNESRLVLGEMMQAKKDYPQFSTADISQIEWPENAAAIIRGLSPDDKEIIGDELASMFRRGESDELGNAVIVPDSVEELLQLTDEIADYDPERVLRDALDVAQRNYAEANRGYEGGKSAQISEARARIKFIQDQFRKLRSGQELDPEFQQRIMPGARNSRTYDDPQFQSPTQDRSSKLLRLFGEAFRERGVEMPAFADTNMGSRQGQVSTGMLERYQELQDDLDPKYIEETKRVIARDEGPDRVEAVIQAKREELAQLEGKMMEAADGAEISKGELITQIEQQEDEFVAQSLTTLFARDGKLTPDGEDILAILWNADPNRESLPDVEPLSAMNRLFQHLKDWGNNTNPLSLSRAEYQEGIVDLLTSSYMKTNLGAGTGAADVATTSNPANRFDTNAGMKQRNPGDPEVGDTTGGRLPTDGDNTAQQRSVDERRTDFNSANFANKYRQLAYNRRQYRERLRKLESADTQNSLRLDYNGKAIIDANTVSNREWLQKRIADIDTELGAMIQEMSDVTGTNPRVAIQTQLEGASRQTNNPGLSNIDNTPGGGRTFTMDAWKEHLDRVRAEEPENTERAAALRNLTAILQGQERSQTAIRTPEETAGIVSRAQREYGAVLNEDDFGKFRGMLRDLDALYEKPPSTPTYEPRVKGTDIGEGDAEPEYIPTAQYADTSILSYGNLPEVQKLQDKLDAINAELETLPSTDIGKRDTLVNQRNRLRNEIAASVRPAGGNGTIYVSDPSARRIMSNVIDGNFAPGQLDVGSGGNPFINEYVGYSPDRLTAERKRILDELKNRDVIDGKTAAIDEGDVRSKDDVNEPDAPEEVDTSLGSTDDEALNSEEGAAYLDKVSASGGGTESTQLGSTALDAKITAIREAINKGDADDSAKATLGMYEEFRGRLEAIDKVEKGAVGADQVVTPESIDTQLVFVKRDGNDVPFLRVEASVNLEAADNNKGVATTKTFYLPVETEQPTKPIVGGPPSEIAKIELKDGKAKWFTPVTATETGPAEKIETTGVKLRDPVIDDEDDEISRINKSIIRNLDPSRQSSKGSKIVGPDGTPIVRQNQEATGKTAGELGSEAVDNQNVTPQRTERSTVNNGTDENLPDQTESSENTRRWNDRLGFLNNRYVWGTAGTLAGGGAVYGIGRLLAGDSKEKQVPLNETKTGPLYEEDRQEPISPPPAPEPVNNIRNMVKPPAPEPVPVQEPVPYVDPLDGLFSEPTVKKQQPATPYVDPLEDLF